MRINYNVKGNERKELVKAVSEVLICKAKYLGAPSFSYEVGGCTIDRNGVIETPQVSDFAIKSFIEDLAAKGFTGEAEQETVEEAETDEEPQQIALTIQMPKTLFTPESIENLNRLLEAKGALIQKALGLQELPEAVDEGDKLSFPWFKVDPKDADLVEAYGKLVCALCDMASKQKRVTAKEQHPANEKYAFRCFLLRLGFIGPDCKKVRASLLKNLTGSSSWKDDVKHENA
jgi:hypothetical protein